MKLARIKRAKCRQCKQFVSCAFNYGAPTCKDCDPKNYIATAEAQKEAWLRGSI